MTSAKPLVMLLAVAVLAAAQATAPQISRRIVDLETDLPEGLRPITENIKNLETHERDILAKQGKIVADLQARHQQAPGDARIEAQLYQAKSRVANEVVAGETSLGLQYDAAADKTRQWAANMQPCVKRPEIAEQRDHTRRKVVELTAKGEDLRRGADPADSAATAQLEQVANQLEQAIATLTRLDEAEQAQAKHCVAQTRQLAQLNWWAETLTLSADLHYLRAAQATVDSLLALIHLQDLADRQTVNGIVDDLTRIQPGGYNALHELEQILGEKQ
jgi:hypothetical protein